MQKTVQKAMGSTCIKILSAALLLSWAGETAATVIRQGVCIHWGGGHITTYDGKKYDYYETGLWQLTDHQLSGAASFRTDIRKYKPTPDYPMAYANGAATRCGDNVLKVTGDDGLTVTLNGMPVEESSDFNFGPDNAYHLRRTGSDYGEFVELNCPAPQNADRWSRVKVNFGLHSGNDYLDIRTFTNFYTPGEETTGMCGSFNQNPNDDFEGLAVLDWIAQYELEESASLFAPQFYGNPEPPIYAEPRQLEFDGQTSHLIDEQYTLTPQFYVRAHVRVDASEQWNHIVEIGSQEYEWNGPLRVEVGEEGQWYVSVGDGQTYSEIALTGNWTYGEWVLLEVEYKGGTIRLWENGEHLGSKEAGLQVDSVSGELNIGNFARGGRYFKGALRNLRIMAIE